MNIKSIYFPKCVCVLLSANDIEYNREIISNQIGHEFIFDEEKIIDYLSNNHMYDDNDAPLKIISNITFKNNLIIPNMFMNYREYIYMIKKYRKMT